MLSIEARMVLAMKSGGWWTSIDLAAKTGDEIKDIERSMEQLMARDAFDCRHLGNVLAFRLRELDLERSDNGNKLPETGN